MTDTSDDYKPIPLDDALRILLKVPATDDASEVVPEQETEEDESAGEVCDDQ